ncbi:hypothetical protein ADK86_33510 [Streptomyces sp. NRRL F-5755]|uniref:hypothetical protein n=1 Tax=Streptomyces sp. NRRL F-5755 TaxID=1519475 RepID=UPI0006ADDBCB|nr:hypothetical protein [Streptomyces sp. NRRL F-5755]KOT88154.1 hypothetical protein ADK86_33510 [Streptomyces sp. NRRL F-5755]
MQRTAPRRQCVPPVRERGSRPQAEGRGWPLIRGALPRGITDRFDEEGYLRAQLPPGLRLPWQDAFGTKDRAEVQAYCDANAIE